MVVPPLDDPWNEGVVMGPVGSLIPSGDRDPLCCRVTYVSSGVVLGKPSDLTFDSRRPILVSYCWERGKTT